MRHRLRFSLLVAGALGSSFCAPSRGDALLDRLLVVEDRRMQGDRALLSSLTAPSLAIRRRAMEVAGRIKDPGAIDALAALLNRKKVEQAAKLSAVFSLGIMATDVSVKIVQQHSQFQNDRQLLEGILFAMGRSGSETTVANLVAYLNDDSPEDLNRAAAQGLGLLWSGASEKWSVPPGVLQRLLMLAAGRGPAAVASAFALSRFKGETSQLPAPGLLELSLRAPEDDARAFIIRTLAKIKTPESTLSLVREAADEKASRGRRIEAVKALAQHPPSDAGLAALARVLANTDTHLLASGLEAVYAWGPVAMPLLDTVDKLYRTGPSNWIKGLALRALASMNPASGKAKANDVLAAPRSPLTEAAAGALAVESTPMDLEKLVNLLDHPDVRVVEAALDGLALYSEDRLPLGAKPALRKVLLEGHTGPTCLVAQMVEKQRWKDFGSALASSYPLLDDIDQIEAKIAVLRALGVVGDYSHVETLQTAINDNERLVALAAVAAKKAITGNDDSARVPPTSKITKPPTPTWDQARQASQQRVRIQTNRGEAVLKMLPDAPLTAYHFVRLVKEKFYDGKTFHRVVPNFIVQGGDPSGDGYGGPGFLLRDEPSVVSHKRGTVGIATAGPDTGGCQFFVNLTANMHLDAKYTVFAEVVSGMNVFDKMEVGDRILSARVQ